MKPRLALAPGCLALAAWMLASAGRVDAQQLRYSNLDRATVRVFSIQNVGIKSVVGETGTQYQVAVPEAGHGSGVIVSSDGLILTAEHVVHNARRVAVKVPGSDRALPATVIHVDVEKDFAFLVVDGHYQHFVPIPDVSAELSVRQQVSAIGYPLDADRDTPQSSQGIVAGSTNDGRLQLSMAVNPGNSGGPLVDEQEQLLGVVVARGDPNRGIQGIAIAVPIDVIRPVYLGLRGAGSPFLPTRAKLAAQPAAERVIAAVLTRLVQVGSVSGVMNEVDRQLSEGTAGPLREELRAALRSGSRDPDVLTLAATYFWNGAIWMAEKRRGNPDKALTAARGLCRDASAIDPAISQRSPFVALVLSQQSPWGTAWDDIRATSSTAPIDLAVIENDTLPTFVLGLRMGLLHPSFMVAGGLELTLWLAPVYINIEYLFGFSALSLGTSEALDAFAGVAIAQSTGQTRATFYRAFAGLGSGVVSGLATVNVGHALLLEAGITARTVVFSRCANTRCTPASTYDDELEPFRAFAGAPAIGVRYIRSYEATLANGATAGSHFTAYAHLFALPFGTPSGRYYYSDLGDPSVEDSTHHAGNLGGVVGTSYATRFGSWQGALGYFPPTQSWLAHLTYGFDFRF